MLATLSEIKSYLGIGTSDYDDFLNSQGALVTDVIEAYCRRKFSEATFAQTFYDDENATTRMMTLFHFPVASITSIVEDDVTLAATEYRLNTAHGMVTRLNGGRFFCSEETVVTYVGGLATVPTPVLEAFYSILQERYNKQSSGVNINFGTDVQRVSIPGAISIDFDYSLNNNERKSYFGTVIGNHMNILDYYRSERAILPGDKLIYIEEP